MPPSAFIPFNRPPIARTTLHKVGQAFQRHHISGNGRFGQDCEKVLARLLGAPRVLLTTSCTHALEMSALLLRLKAGDEVIVPAFTFVSTANAYALRGAKPVFADIRPDTLNLDETRLAAAITPRTRAIVVVHYAGVGCEMDAISALARRHRLPVIEDNAHGLFGRYRGRPLGSLGDLATLSFHETKNITCGEGGALVLNRERLAGLAEIIREKGTDRSRFLQGLVDKYTWQSLGSSYVISDLLAAALLAQLEERRRIQRQRQALWTRYHRELRTWAQAAGVRQPVVPPHCTQAYHMYYLLLPTARARRGFAEHLKKRRIQAVFHYVPLHCSPMGRHFGGRQGQCPVTEAVSESLIRLPFYTDMTAAEQSRVLEAAAGFSP